MEFKYRLIVKSIKTFTLMSILILKKRRIALVRLAEKSVLLLQEKVSHFIITPSFPSQMCANLCENSQLTLQPRSGLSHEVRACFCGSPNKQTKKSTNRSKTKLFRSLNISQNISRSRGKLDESYRKREGELPKRKWQRSTNRNFRSRSLTI